MNEDLNVSPPNKSSGSENKYSIEETVIGEWIDGKPIYRRIITENLPKIGAVNAIVTIAKKSDYDIDQIINSEYYVKRTDGWEHLASKDAYLGCGWLNDIVALNTHSAYINATIEWVKLEYTKTTD